MHRSDAQKKAVVPFLLTPADERNVRNASLGSIWPDARFWLNLFLVTLASSSVV